MFGTYPIDTKNQIITVVIFAHPLIRKFLNKTDLQCPHCENYGDALHYYLKCPNCENYADAFHYYYIHPFRKFLNATDLPTFSQLVNDDDKGKRPTRYVRTWFAMYSMKHVL